MCGCAMRRQELIVNLVDLARLIRRDILEMQRSQLLLGWLVVVAVANRPGLLMNWRSLLCISDICHK